MHFGFRLRLFIRQFLIPVTIDTIIQCPPATVVILGEESSSCVKTCIDPARLDASLRGALPDMQATGRGLWIHYDNACFSRIGFELGTGGLRDYVCMIQLQSDGLLLTRKVR